MPKPAKPKWWDDAVSVDTVKLNDNVHLLWGDRVRVLQKDDATGKVKVFARGSIGWIAEDKLGGAPLLELYFIDVGQGDGVLIVTPEGHHIMIDGGNMRRDQQTGKSAADFVDWKFHKDYLLPNERGDAAKDVIRFDAMIATHADADHYGGLRDLVDKEVELKADELDTLDTTTECFCHPGLSPQETGSEELGPKESGYFVRLLEDRASATEAVKAHPAGGIKLRGWWRDFIVAILQQKTAAGDLTPIKRLSNKTPFLPGFADTDDSTVKIHVLAPVEATVNGKPALRDLGNEGVNKNGHSIALRLDYGKRRILLTGDLNDASHADIMKAYGADFGSAWKADVAKACHHGSHHVDFDFLKGVNALSTVFSSGDANTYDHPRAWVLGAAALSGRVIKDPKKPRLKAPLIYSTEIARSLSLRGIDQLREYDTPQEYGPEKTPAVQTVSGQVTESKWRVVLNGKSADARDLPPLPDAKVMRNIIYGLVNVRTDGKRLLFAVRNEGNSSWAYETMEEAEIDSATGANPS